MRSERSAFSQARESHNYDLSVGGEHLTGVSISEQRKRHSIEERAAVYVGRTKKLPPEERYQLLDMLGLLDAAKRVTGREE